MRLLLVLVALSISAADWEREKPEDHGYSTKRLDALKGYLATIDTTAMMAVHKGKVIFEYGDLTKQSYLASVRKSLLAMLYGKYVANGKINLDATLEELGMDDVGGLLPREKQAKVRHLITARSGVYHPASYPGDDLAQAPPRGTQQPGTYHLYSNWDFNAAGSVFEKQTGMDIYDALQKDLAEPLGMQDFDRSLQKKAGNVSVSKYEAYPIWLTTRDMARIGQLMLQNGKWEGKQVVASDWIKTITTLVTPVHDMNPPSARGYANGTLWGYGYMWWIWDDHNRVGPLQGAYTGIGAVGQYITVLPALDLVIAHKTVPAAQGQAARGVTGLQYHAALMQLINARCGRVCP
jgi:CubicO group peptidase (beta-lactamase class C family)